MKLTITVKYTCSGIVFGFFFPLIAWALDIFIGDLTLSVASVVRIHQESPIHYIIDMAPVVLAISFYYLGKAYQHALNKNYFSALFVDDIEPGLSVGLKLTIAITLVLTIVLLGGSSWYIQSLMSRQAEDEIGRLVDTILSTTKQATDLSFREEEFNVLLWARTDQVQMAALELMPRQSSRQELLESKTKIVLQDWFEPISKIRGYQGYFIVSTEGINLSSSRDESVGQPNRFLQAHPEFLATIRAGNTALSTPHHSHITLINKEGMLAEGITTIFVGAPVRDQSGEIIAALTFRLDPKIGLSSILRQGRIGESGETYAFIKEGEIITRSRFEQQIKTLGLSFIDAHGTKHFEVRDPGVNLVLGEQSDVPRGQQAFTHMAINAMQGKSGKNVKGYRDYRGVPVVGSWLWDDRLGFGMTTEMDVAEAYATLTFNLRIIHISTLILGIFIAGFVVLLIRFFQESRKTKQIHLENEQTTRLLLNSTGEGIYGVGLDGQCTFVNMACLNLLGYLSEHELLGKNMHQLIHYARKDGNIYPVKECKIYRSYKTGEAIYVDDEVFWRTDGSSFDVAYRSFPILNHGEIIGSVLSFTDITERLRIEQQEQNNLDNLIRFKDATAEIVTLGEAIEGRENIIPVQKRVQKLIAIALDTERVSIWYYDDSRSSLVADSLYKKTENEYDSDLTLLQKELPNYFAALAEEVILIGDDAQKDPRSRELEESYLKIHAITAFMDAPIKIQGQTIGVIRVEHVGQKRTWSLLEQEFVISIAIFLALALETRERARSETRQLAIVNTMSDGLITYNEEGLIEAFNPAAENIFGYSAEEIIGKNVRLLMPESHHSNYNYYLATYKSTGIARALGVGGAIEVDGTRKDHSEIPISISLSEMYIGEERYFNAVIRNITDRKALEKEREQVAAELTQLIDTINAPIFGLDMHGILNEWNQQVAKLSGYSRQEIEEQGLLTTLIPEEYRQSIIAVFNKAFEGEDTESFDLLVLTKENTQLNILLNISSRRDLDGNISGVIAVGQDITGLREKENALHQAQKMEAVGQLTGGLAHDFNNLLSIIGGNLRFLQQDIGEKHPEIQELFDDAMSAVTDGAALTRRLLGFSRTSVLATKVINVNDVVNNFTDFLRRTLGGQVALKIDESTERLFINIDTAQLENALLNLALNARDAMPDGGQLSIDVTRRHLDLGEIINQELQPGDYVLITVTDTGEGIEPGDLDHVFEPFFTRKDIDKGSGLGLSTVYGFTRQSGGICHISSNLGEGTTVTMFFPEEKSAEIESTSEEKSISTVNNLFGGKETILVVEDETRVRRVVVRDLEKLGYTVLEAESAAAAIKVLEEEDVIDLLFTDILMPGELNGRGLAEWTKTHYPRIKILLTSGYSKDNSSSTTVEAQQYLPVLTKPYTIEKMTKQIKDILSA